MKNTKKHWLCIVPVLYWAPTVYADYKTDIGYSALQTLLGANTPTGAGVNVLQAEAGGTVYAPDTTNSQFSGKTFTFPGAASVSPSGHATGVGSIFYGSNAMATGLNNITDYEYTAWVQSLLKV